MTPLLLVAGAIVGIGAAVATGARDARIASLGLVGLLVAAPFVADPLPAPLPAPTPRNTPSQRFFPTDDQGPVPPANIGR